ncbi:MAG TPA: hypothetical protein VMT15_09390 [Bryobacteraceae bacterium]|nr:hypothetical protein [Bryobacteraceae bacterium]
MALRISGYFCVSMRARPMWRTLGINSSVSVLGEAKCWIRWKSMSLVAAKNKHNVLDARIEHGRITFAPQSPVDQGIAEGHRLRNAPAAMHEAFRKQAEFLLTDLRHPSLQAKKYGAIRTTCSILRSTRPWRD